MSPRAAWTTAALTLLLAGPAAAHDPTAARGAWAPDPLVAFNLATLAAVYALGLRRLWARDGGAKVVTPRRAGAFAAGLVVLVAALLSPLAAVAEELNWVHMVQHMLLMNVAAPLVVLGAPLRVTLWALPVGARRAWGGALGRLDGWRPGGYLLGQALLMWALYGLVLWVWHVPRFYEAALRAPRLHDLQHLSFFVVSCLFWRVLLDPVRRLALSRALSVVYLFATSLHATLLGVFMALSPAAWYPIYEPRVRAWGLTALEDQQVAGLIMWMPACMIYAAIAAVLFGLWLHEEGEREVEPCRAT